MARPTVIPTNMAGRALRLRRPFGRTAPLAAGLAALLALGAEGAARLPGVRARFPFTSTNNPNGQFDYLLSQLDQAAARQGGLECVVLGSSLVAAGFNAAAFEAGYTAAGGAAPAPGCGTP